MAMRVVLYWRHYCVGVSGDLMRTCECFALQASFREVTFRQCQASTLGGGLVLLQAIADVADCTFDLNTAANGGAIYARASSVDLQFATFSANQAQAGGAVYLEYSTFRAQSVVWSGNNALQYGGGLYCQGERPCELMKSSVLNNTAELDGGALYAVFCTLNIAESRLFANQAGAIFGNDIGRGGAVALGQSGGLVADKCEWRFTLVTRPRSRR